MRMILPLLANAGYVLAVQLLALLTLNPADFGSFSLFYLAFALGVSLTLSIVSEAWVRRENAGEVRAPWDEFARASFSLAMFTSALALSVALTLEPLRSIAFTGSAAVLLATFRTAARYHDVRVGRGVGVAVGDILGLLVTIAGGLMLVTAIIPTSLESVVLIWGLGSAASLIATRPFRVFFRSRGMWARNHKQYIGPLLRDSLLLDAGSIGTPLLLAPLLGLTGFGIYRAISNVAAPVRLVLNPLRPLIAARDRQVLSSVRRVLEVLFVSSLFGALAAGALVVIGKLPIELGALSGVAPFAVPTGLFVAANFLGHYFYIVCRAHASGNQLMTGRIVQTATAVLLPVAGFFLGGLPGAIWGYATCTTISALVWLRVATLQPK